jgi:hypothetical protein
VTGVEASRRRGASPWLPRRPESAGVPKVTPGDCVDLVMATADGIRIATVTARLS